MKLKNIFLVMFAAALAMVGCTKPIDFGDPDIKVTPEEIQVPMAGGSVTVTVNTTRAWKLRDLPDWIVAEPESGPASFEDQQVTLTFLENKKGNRYASIKFFAGIVSEFADIKQPGPDGETGGIDQITVKEFLEKADPNTEYRLVGVVSAFNSEYCSFNLTDESGSTVYVYSVDDASKEEFSDQIMNGGIVTLTGKYYYYQHKTDPSKNKVEINNAHIERYEDPAPIDPSTIEQITVAEFIQKADPLTAYRLVGKVRGFNSQYCSFDIVDETGSIYVYSLDAASKTDFGSKIKDGGTITIIGNYYYYVHSSDPSKNKVEIKDATIEKYEDAEPVDPSKIEQITVAEFLQKADPNTAYRLVGTVSNFNSQYCSFDLTDASGKIYVYSLDAASKEAFGSKIMNDGVITITGKYYYYEHSSDPSKNKAEIKDATIEKYEDPGVIDPTTIEQITVAEFLQKADPNTTYRLVGTVSNFNSQYCSFDLTDASGKIYVYSLDAASKEAFGSKIMNDGVITITGKYYYYQNSSDPSKNKAEIKDATIEKYEDPGVIDPTTIEQITVAEFLRKADPNTTYRLVGTVSNFNSQYCSFDLTDASGTIYVYSLAAASKTEFGSKIQNGGKVTLTGKYYYYQNSSDPSKNKIEIKDATIEKYEGSTDPVDPGKIEQITVAEFLQKADPNTTYRLVGTVSNFNSQYCSFDLTDASGKIYVYSLDAASKEAFGSKIMNDGVITITGKYYYYQNSSDPSKNKAEIKDATIEKYEDPGVIDPTTIEQITVAEFLRKADPNTTYRLVGTVSNFNSQYCSFDLTDASGTIYVYSLAAASKTEFGSKIQNGGKVTLTGKYYYYQNSSDPSKNKIEIKDATIEKYEGSTDPVDPVDPVVTGDSVTLTFPDDNSANNAGSGYGLSWVAKKGNYSFNVVNFNNNKWSNNWTFIKCGHKTTAYNSSIANSTPIPAKIDKVIVNIDRVLDASKVTAFELVVATDANFSTVTETIKGTMAQGDQTFNIANPVASGYYKIVINCNALGGSTNGCVTVAKIVYSAKAN